jgi:hypothetical protein
MARLAVSSEAMRQSRTWAPSSRGMVRRFADIDWQGCVAIIKKIGNELKFKEKNLKKKTNTK